jgi:DNA-binding transcriptional ArsR family regulator
MPASKTLNYTSQTMENALFGRALAHPARITIIDLLRKRIFSTNQALSIELDLSVSTINNHLRKLLDADLVVLEYSHKFMKISLSGKHRELISSILDAEFN